MQEKNFRLALEFTDDNWNMKLTSSYHIFTFTGLANLIKKSKTINKEGRKFRIRYKDNYYPLSIINEITKHMEFTEELLIRLNID